MKGVYQQADLFLLPTEYEIFGMVLLEAMFFRRVVLTTPTAVRICCCAAVRTALCWKIGPGPLGESPAGHCR